MSDYRKSGRPKMEKAVCDNCGKQCEVPFKPTGDKPVYCSECFETHGDKRFDKRSGGPGFGKRNSRRDERSNTEMFQATCDECGNSCEVPFKPTSGKPVYCSDCFQKQNGGNDRRGGDRRDDRRGGDRRNDRRDSRGDDRRRDSRSNYRDNNRDREMFTATCDECGNECKLPFRPSSNKPVYCSNCFEQKNRHVENKGTNYEGKSKDMKQLREQFDKLNQKVDDVMEMLVALSEGKKLSIKKEEETTPVTEPVVETTETVETEPKEEKKKPAKKKTAKKETKTEEVVVEEVVEEVKPEEVTVYETPEQLASTEPAVEEVATPDLTPVEPVVEEVAVAETPVMEPTEKLETNEPTPEPETTTEEKKDQEEMLQ